MFLSDRTVSASLTEIENYFIGHELNSPRCSFPLGRSSVVEKIVFLIGWTQRNTIHTLPKIQLISSKIFFLFFATHPPPFFFQFVTLDTKE